MKTWYKRNKLWISALALWLLLSSPLFIKDYFRGKTEEAKHKEDLRQIIQLARQNGRLEYIIEDIKEEHTIQQCLRNQCIQKLSTIDTVYDTLIIDTVQDTLTITY